MTSEDFATLTREAVTDEESAGEQNTGGPFSVENDGEDVPRSRTTQDAIVADHNRVLVDNPTGAKSNFDIGRFSLLQIGAETDIVSAAARSKDRGPTTDLTRQRAKLVPNEAVGTDVGETNTSHEVGPVDVNYIGSASTSPFAEISDFGPARKTASNIEPFELTLTACGCAITGTASNQADPRGPGTCFCRSTR